MAKLPGTKRTMDKFQIVELSGVDRPAQTHAKMTLMKRDDLIKGEDIHESFIKKWIDPADGAKPFQEVVQECLDDKKFYEAMGVVGEDIYALETSLRSIAGDASMDGSAKESMMRNSVEEFMASMRGKMPEVTEALSKVLTHEAVSKGDHHMPGENENTVEALTKQVADLTKRLEAAEKVSKDANAASEMQKQLDEVSAERDALKAESDARKAFEDSVAKMSDEEKAYMRELDEEKQKAFAAATKEERNKMLSAKKAAEKDDEVIKVEGVGEIRKSAVGEAQFSIFKVQQERLEKQDEDLRKERERREEVEYTKRATDNYPNLPGEAIEKARVLRAIDALPDEAVRKSMASMLEAGEKAIKAAFDSLGTKDGGDVEKSAETFSKRVDDIAKRDNISKMEAMQKARVEYPDEFKAFQQAN